MKNDLTKSSKIIVLEEDAREIRTCARTIEKVKGCTVCGKFAECRENGLISKALKNAEENGY